MIATLFVVLLTLLLAWANGANDIAKGVATLTGSGIAQAQRSIAWGTLWTVLGGLVALFWGWELVRAFGGEYLNTGFRVTPAFLASVLLAASAWVLFASRYGLPVSTTHALLGGTIGAALAVDGVDAVRAGVVANKALLPLLVSPILAIALCGTLLYAGRYVTRRLPSWRPGCCAPEEWRHNPFVCAVPETRPPRWQQRLWIGLHWLSGGATSFARGLNDTPKIAALWIVALGLIPPTGEAAGLAAIAWPMTAVAVTMGLGCLWGGHRVLEVLAHRVAPLDAGTGFTANLGTSFLVLAATPLGLPVSTTHVSTGALLGVRLAERKKPDRADALKLILFGWVVTFPVTALAGAFAGYLAAGN